mgnify:FL=1
MSKSNMNLKLVTGLLMASGSTVALASMNNLNVQSNLGEQFSGSIVVTGPTAQEILKSPASISVSGAPVSARVSKQGDSAVIHLRSSVPINDPVLRLKVQAGTESRQYSAIIDPKNAVHQSAQVNPAKAIPHPPALASNNEAARKPTATPAHKAATPKPAQQTIQNNRAQAATAAAPSNIAIAQQYKVQAQDNIFEIARRYQPDGLSTAQTVQALMRANPQAFRNHNPNLLYGDATLKIPSADAMHQLVKGRSAKHVAAATAATAAVATTTAPATTAATADDVANIEKQLADLEQQKAQLEKQLVQAQQASAAAESTAAPVATASAPTVAASTPVAAPASTPAVAPTKATPPAPIPPVPEEKGLMDLLVDYLPYLAIGLVALLILAMLIARSRKKAAASDEVALDESEDDAVEIFNFDEAALDTDKVSLSKTDDIQNQLTDAELEALNSFNPQEDKAFHQSTAQPTAAPQTSSLATGATALVGGAAVAAAAHAASEQDFMPSDEELAQYAQPSATEAPASDDFNLDDLDSLLKQGEVETQLATAEPTAHDDFNFDFDVNELAQNNSLNLSTPALDFPDVDTVVEAPVATHLPQVEDVNFGDFDVEVSATAAPSNEFDLDLGTVALGAAGVAAASHLVQDTPATENEGLTLSQDDINAINFDDFNTSTTDVNTAVATDTNVDIDALFQDEAEAAVASPVSKFNSIPMDSGHELTFDDSFNLNFDDLLSVDEAAVETPNSISTAAASLAEAPEEISFDNIVETAAPVAEIITPVAATAMVEDSRPAQAWAGTGNFGNPSAAETISTTTDAEPQATEFDLDFNLDTAAPTATVAPEVAEEALFANDDIMSFDLDVPSIDSPATSEVTEVAHANTDAAADLSFDLDALNLDSISNEAPAAVETTASDVSFDLDALSLDAAPTEITALADTTIADVSFDLDAPSADSVSAATPAAVADDALADMSFDLDALSLDTATEPAIQPAPTATPDSSNNFDFSLDDLNAAVTPATAEATAAPDTDFSLDDFNLEEFASVEATEVAATPAADVDFNLDSLSLDNIGETAPVAALPEEAAPVLDDTPVVAAAESADNLALQTLQHTQDAKLDLAKMYIEIGDKDAAMNILADLMENGSNDAAERAQALYQSL